MGDVMLTGEVAEPRYCGGIIAKHGCNHGEQEVVIVLLNPFVSDALLPGNLAKPRFCRGVVAKMRGFQGRQQPRFVGLPDRHDVFIVVVIKPFFRCFPDVVPGHLKVAVIGYFGIEVDPCGSILLVKGDVHGLMKMLDAGFGIDAGIARTETRRVW